MKNKTILALAISMMIGGCSDDPNTIKLKAEMQSEVTLVGVIDKNKFAESGDPSSYHLNLAIPLTIINNDSQLCDKKSKISEIEIFYKGDNAFDGIEGKQVSLVGKIDCPRGSFVFRDIDFSIKDGPIIKKALDNNAAIARERSEKSEMADKCYIKYNAALNANINWARAFFRQRGYNEAQAGAMDIGNYDLIAGLQYAFETRKQLGSNENLDNDIKSFINENYSGSYTLSVLDERVHSFVDVCNRYFGENNIKSRSKQLLTDSVNGNPHPILNIYTLKIN